MRYLGRIIVEYKEPPTLMPIPLPVFPRKGLLQNIFGAMTRRRYLIEENWLIQLTLGDNYPANLTGVAVVNEGLVTDGASVPFPWLISFLSLGVIRPDGILLLPSILHDCIYQNGGLFYLRGGLVFEPVGKDTADNLFRDMVATMTGLSWVAFVVWVGIKLWRLFPKD